MKDVIAFVRWLHQDWLGITLFWSWALSALSSVGFIVFLLMGHAP